MNTRSTIRIGFAITALTLVAGPSTRAECTASDPAYRQEMVGGEVREITITCTNASRGPSGGCDGTIYSDPGSPIQVTPGSGEFHITVDNPLVITATMPNDVAIGSNHYVDVLFSFGGQYTDDCRGSLGYDIRRKGDGLTRGGLLDAGWSSDPVGTFTGELFNQYPADLDLGGPMPLRFSRYYASLIVSDGLIAGSLGTNWLHDFEWTLTTSPTLTTIIDNRGRSINFTKPSSTWRIAGKEDIAFRLTEDAGEFVLADPRTDWLLTFDGTGKLIQIADAKGNVHTLSYAGGRLSSVSDGLGRTLGFSYTGDRLVSVSDGTRVVSFEQAGDDLTRVTDAVGNVTTFAYDPGGLMTSTTRPAGNTPFAQIWNGTGQVVSQNDAAGNVTTFAYSSPDTTITDPLGNVQVHRHSMSGDLSEVQNASGHAGIVGSDGKGRRGLIEDRTGDTTWFNYDASSGKAGRIDFADGTSVSQSYHSRYIDGGRLYKVRDITHRDGTQESFGYDTLLNRTSYTDQAGEMATATYNGNGQPLTMTNRAGGVTTFSYNVDGTLHSTTDPAGNETVLDYDLLRRPVGASWDDGSTRMWVLDDNDRVTSVTDENGGTWTTAYDANGRLASTTLPSGAASTFAYDGNDRLTGVTDPLGHTTTLGYDPAGRPATLTDPAGSVFTRGYDPTGRPVSVTDPLGNASTIGYDVEGAITSYTDPLGHTTTFGVDVMGRRTGMTTPLGRTTGFAYDVNGRIASVTDPLGGTTTVSRDVRGQVSAVSLPGGVVGVSHQRNALGQIVATTDPNGNDWQTGFDDLGRLTSRTDPLGRTTTVTYDARHRPSTITYPEGMGTLTITRDAVGNPVRRSWSDGTTLEYAYDADNRLVSGTGIALTRDANGRIVDSNGIAIVRDVQGLITSMTFAAGKTVTYGYDAVGRLTQVTDWVGGSTGFTYDAAGQLTGITRPNGIDTTFTHDDDGRLVGIAEGAISDIALTRDGNGQVAAVDRAVPQAATVSGVTELAAAYDAASQATTDGYDALGRLTASGGDTFVWDLASLLVSYTVDGNTVNATYDARGKRTSRTDGGVTRNFVWNRALGLTSLSIEREGGADLRYWVHTPEGTLLYGIDAATNARHFHHFDSMGNTVIVTDDAGTTAASYAYTPFGRRTSTAGTLDNPFTWQGAFGVVDDGRGIYYARARYYDSRAARFLSRDRIKSVRPREINPYQYARLNPRTFNDPSGLKPAEIEITEGTLIRAHWLSGAAPRPNIPEYTTTDSEIGLPYPEQYDLETNAVVLAVFGIFFAPDEAIRNALSSTGQSSVSEIYGPDSACDADGTCGIAPATGSECDWTGACEDGGNGLTGNPGPCNFGGDDCESGGEEFVWKLAPFSPGPIWFVNATQVSGPGIDNGDGIDWDALEEISEEIRAIEALRPY